MRLQSTALMSSCYCCSHCQTHRCNATCHLATRGTTQPASITTRNQALPGSRQDHIQGDRDRSRTWAEPTSAGSIAVIHCWHPPSLQLVVLSRHHHPTCNQDAACFCTQVLPTS